MEAGERVERVAEVRARRLDGVEHELPLGLLGERRIGDGRDGGSLHAHRVAEPGSALLDDGLDGERLQDLFVTGLPFRRGEAVAEERDRLPALLAGEPRPVEHLEEHVDLPPLGGAVHLHPRVAGVVAAVSGRRVVGLGDDVDDGFGKRLLDEIAKLGVDFHSLLAWRHVAPR